MKNLNLKAGRGHRIGRAVGVFAVAAVALSACGKSADEFIARAKTQLDAGNIPAAIIELKNALQKEPKNFAARVMLGQAYLDISDAVDAEVDLLKAREDGADRLAIAKPLAESELQLGKFDKALTESEFPPNATPQLKASLYAVRALADIGQGKIAAGDDAFAAGLKEDPQSVDLLVAIVRISVARRDLPTARDRLADAEKQAPADPRVVALTGTVAFADGKYADAEEAFARAVKAQPWNIAERTDLAQSQVAQAKWKEADETLTTVLKSSPKAPRANYLRAVTAFQEQDYATAQARVQNVLAVSESPPALLLAGAINYQLNQFEQANSYLAKYVTISPDDVNGRQLLGATQLQLGRAADAVKTLSPAVAKTDSARLLALIGEASARNGDAAGAEKYLTQALEKQPNNTAVRTELGLTKVSLGQTDAGIEEFEKASKQDPKDVGPDAALFGTYLRNKDYDKALQVAETLQGKQPTNPLGLDYAGIAQWGKGDRDAAQGSFLKAKELKPDDPVTLRLLAVLSVQMGKPDDAMGYYETLAKADPKDAQTSIAIAQLDLQGGKADSAQATLQKAIELDPDNVAPRIALARLLLIQGKGQEALNTLQPAMAKNPRQPELLEAMGQAQLATGQVESALASFNLMVNVAPQASAAHRELALAYMAARSPDKALPEAQEAVRLAPDDKPTRLSLATVLVTMRNFDEARQRVDGWAAGTPQDADYAELQGIVASGQNRAQDAVDAFQHAVTLKDGGTTRARLSMAQEKAGRPDAAETTLKDWVQAHPDDGLARTALASFYIRAKRTVEARDQFAELVRQTPNDVGAENNLAWTLSELGQQDEALQHAQHAAAAAPNEPNVQDTLGVILLRSGKAAEARDTLQKAATAAPTANDIQVHLAQALAATGDKDKAREILRTALAGKDPFDERDSAQKLLKDLGG